MRTWLIVSFTFLVAALSLAQGHRPKEGFVPDSATAIKIAEAVLVPVYGQNKLESERPFTAKLEDDVWTVSGTFHCLDDKGRESFGCFGGAAQVKISKKDARVLSMIFGR